MIDRARTAVHVLISGDRTSLLSPSRVPVPELNNRAVKAVSVDSAVEFGNPRAGAREGRVDRTSHTRSRIIALLPEKRQLRLAIWRHPYEYVRVAFQDWEYKIEVPLKDVGCIPLVALQEDMLSDRVAPMSLRELAVMADQHSPLIVGVDRQLVVTDPAESSVGRGPGVVTELA